MLERAFRSVLDARRPIVAIGAAVFVASLFLAVRVSSDGSIDRLIVDRDPDYRVAREFGARFPEGGAVVVLLESDDPYSPASLATMEALERALRTVRRAEPFSPLSLYRELRPGESVATPSQAAAFREFATGTDLLRRQGLAGDRFLAVAVGLPGSDPRVRDAVLREIDTAIAPVEAAARGQAVVRRIGRPYVEAWLEGATARASLRYFPLFGAFLVGLILFLYRSKRTLAAFLATLAMCVAATVGVAALPGWSFSIVSSLVPLTVLVTATSTLVYLHSRYVDCPAEVDPRDHHVAALVNKFVPCTASIFAAAAGFAALAVSDIRPVREMGLWTATGLGITWVAAFTLFPALQSLLRTPVQRHREVAGRFFPRFVDFVVPWSYRHRVPLVVAALALMAAGAVALVGIPGSIPAMPLETDALDYVDPDLPFARDTRDYERAVVGLTIVEAWVTTPDGAALAPLTLRAVERFVRELESDPRVGAATGPTTALRWARYAARGDDRLPDDPAAWAGLAVDLEQLVFSQPALRRFVDVESLSDLRITVRLRDSGFDGLEDLRAFLESSFSRVASSDSALAECRLRLAGQGLLQAKIAHHLVPTLVESFAWTAGIIFAAFLFVFRSASGRLLAMIPSLFAILAMFLAMRLASIPLNVATILIASTVLGASENDQIHFFHHLQEKRRDGSTEAALRHAMIVAGRAVLFATVINAGGFLALALSDLPPMRQFGLVSSGAFTLAMLADFTALPAALWLLFGGRPAALSGSASLPSGGSGPRPRNRSRSAKSGGTPADRGGPASR